VALFDNVLMGGVVSKMDKETAIFAFNGETMYFAHALLNVLDMKGKGYDVKLIIEGSATR